MLSGPEGCEEPFSLQCCVCGHRAELFDLPGKTGKYCLECSANLIAEFSHLSTRLLERAQSA
jgi:hypothetical protein